MKTVAVVALALAGAAQAAVSGTVQGPGGPVAGAKVSAYAAKRPNAVCPQTPSGESGLSRCLCPGKLEALQQALETAKAPVPLAEATSAADGSFSLEVDAKDALLVASSADGALGVAGPAEVLLAAGVLSLSPTAPLKVKVVAEVGLDAAGAKLFAWEENSGAVQALARGADGVFTAPAAPGWKMVVGFAPGAGGSWDRFGQTGKPMFNRRPSMRTREVPELQLARWRPLEALVLKGGKPVPGAEVVLMPESCSVAVRTDAQGRFTFPHGFPAPMLTPARVAHGGLVAEEALNPGRPEELSLVAPGAFEATFVDAQKRPLAGLRVDAHFRDASNRRTSWRRLTTDAAGRCRAEFPGSGKVSFSVNSRAWAFAASRSAQVLEGKVARVNLPLAPAVTLEVELVDGAGKPVPSQYLRIFFGEELQPKVSEDLKEALREGGATTDSRGIATFTGLLPGPYEVAVEDFRLGKANAFGSAPGKLRLQLGETPRLVVTVVDQAGKGIPDVGVSLRSEGGNFSTLTDAAGVASLAQAAGKYELTVAVPGGPAGGEKRTVELEPRRTVELSFKGQSQPPLAGLVVDTGGKPVPGAVVYSSVIAAPMAANPALRMMSMRMAEQRAQHAYGGGGEKWVADARGAFAAPAREGERFWAQAEGYAPTEPAEPKDGKVRVVLAPRPVAVGRVLTADGRPVPGASVGGVAVTDAEGRYRATLVEKGAVELPVSAQGRPPTSVKLELKGTETEVRVPDVKLEDGVTVRGTVTDAVTRKPVGSHARLALKLGPGPGQQLTGVARPDGTFELEGAPLRPAELEVSADGYATLVKPLNPSRAPLALALAPLGTLELTVLAAGEPAADVEVRAEGPARESRLGPTEVRSQTTDGLGRLRLTHLSPGAWTLSFKRGGEPFGPPQKVVLKAGESKALSVKR